MAAPQRDYAGDDRYRSTHDRYRSEADASAGCHVLLIGDSIVQQMQFVQFYREHSCKDKIILNFGIGGDRVENVLWRIEDGDWLERLKPKVVVLSVGTNNTDSSADEIVDLLDVTVQTIRRKCSNSHVVIPYLLPRGRFDNRLREKNELTNVLISERFGKKDDTGKISVVKIDKNNIIDHVGQIPHTLLHDYLHLTNEGYRVTWGKVFDHCREILDKM